ncbi:MAG: IS3 family transposase [Betaproteobacteria bacterium]|nr:IS3 family transposase [Betaproteobacteria bacterium]
MSRSGYYAHRAAQPSRTRQRQEVYVRSAFAASGGNYGSRRVMHAVRAQGERIGRYRVRTLMRAAQLRPRWRHKFVATTHNRHDLPVALNLLNRQFEADRPDQAWVSDITYIRTDAGWLYLAVVLDLYGCTWPWCWTCTRAAWWAGRWRQPCRRRWWSRR